MSWTDEARNYAIGLAANHSASEIAIELERKLGVIKTRNAVIGVVNRAGYSLNGGSTAPTQTRQQARIRAAKRKRKRGVTPFNFGFHGKPAIQVTPLPPRHETDIARVSFNDLNEDGKRHCKFAIGDIVPPHQLQFCGLEPLAGQAYCPSHYARCINTIETRHALAVQDAAAQAPLAEVA